MYSLICTRWFVFQPILIDLDLLLGFWALSEPECPPCSSDSFSLFFSIFFSFFFLVFPFSPQPVKADETPWRPAVPRASSYRGVFAGCCRVTLALEGSVGFLLIVLRALRRLWLWFSPLQIKVDRLLIFERLDNRICPGAYPPSLSASSELRAPPLAPLWASGALFLRVGVVRQAGLPRCVSSRPLRSALTWSRRAGRAFFSSFISSFSSDTQRIRASRRSSTSAWPVCRPGPSTNMRPVPWSLLRLMRYPGQELLRRVLKPR